MEHHRHPRPARELPGWVLAAEPRCRCTAGEPELVASADGGDAVTVFAGLRDRVAVACAGLDPQAVPAGQVAAVHAELAAMGRLVEGAQVRLARRVHDTKAWRGSAYTSAVELLAAAAGTTKHAARQMLDTSLRLTGRRPPTGRSATGRCRRHRPRR